MNGVLVAHPGLQHSHQLAWALHEKGLLGRFWSGVPVRNEASEYSWLPPASSAKIKFASIPRYKRSHYFIFPATRTLAGYLPQGTYPEDVQRRLDQYFDWCVSLQIRRLAPTVVVCYENSAYHTFRAAKNIGCICVLDAASVHHKLGEDLFRVRSTPYLAETNRRLQEEVRFADYVLSCSQLAATSYIQAGVPEHQVKTIPLGATLRGVPVARRISDRPVKFLFAGVLSHRKAIDVIIETFQQLEQAGYSFAVDFVGSEGEPGWLDRIRLLAGCTHYPSVGQAELFDRMADADCLLLPSRVDSFGMVVVEAMACGTPVIVSTMVGANMVVAENPMSGWIVEPDTKSLYLCVATLLRNRELLLNARAFAYQASLKYSWDAYRQRAATFFASLPTLAVS